MRRRSAAVVSTFGLAFLAACGSERTTSPRGVGPRDAALTTVVTGWDTVACNFTVIKSDARAFFSSSRDAAFTIIGDMQTAYKIGGAVGATPKGLDVLTRISKARLTSAQGGTADDGGRLATHVVVCTALVPPYADDFDPASALGRGIFEVRGDIATTAPALAYNGKGTTAPIPASPLWGVEGSWPGRSSLVADPRYLVYGYPTGEGADVRETGFELGTLPTNVDVNGLTVAVCATPVSSDSSTASLLVHNTTDILLATNAEFCAAPAAQVGMSTWGGLAHRLASVFTPTTLFAADEFDAIGGLPSGWSPFTINNYVGSGITLQFQQQPTDGSVNTDMTPKVTVTVTRTDGGAVPPVYVTLRIAGNNGTPAFIVNNVALSTSDGVSSTGTASFPNLQFTKAGGYTIIASGSVGGTGVPTGQVLSALFNIKNK